MSIPEPRPPENETHENRLKRLRMRSWRRGIKEMDLILGSYSDAQLDRMEPEMLNVYDLLLSENDQELYSWVTGQVEAPEFFQPLIARITDHANGL